MIIYKTNNTCKNITLHKYSITFFSMLLFLILPKTAYANVSMVALIYIPIILQLTIVLSLFIAVFIKFGLCKLLYSEDAQISLKSFYLSMIVEIIIMSIFTYAFLIYTNKDYALRVINLLSYLSIDIALFYFQKILVEHNYFWSLIGKSLIFIFILSFITFIPNYKLLVKYGNKRLTIAKQWAYSYLFSIIAPAFFCLIILSLVTVVQHSEPKKFSPEYKKAADLKNELLRQAVAPGYSILVKALISNGADINSRYSYDFTPLMIACSYVDAESEIIQLLIDNGADINAQSFHGETALKIASRRNRGIWVEKYGVKDTKIEKLLLDYRADVNIKDTKGRTALMEASQANNIELVKLLLAHGADINFKDNENKTAYMLTSDPNIKQILVNHGAKIF